MINEEVRVVSTAGILGYGFPEDSLARAMERRPHVIGCDAGSTDRGPGDLGAGTVGQSREACKRDLLLMLRAARAAKIPMIVGTCGGAGADVHVKAFEEIVREIAKDEGLHFKLAVIRSDQDKASLKARLRAGRVRQLDHAPQLTREEIDAAERIVAMMGPEPMMRALREGADVILAGRSTDTSIFAAYPLMEGMEPGPVWHAAKLLECGGSSAVPSSAGDCLMATIGPGYFVIEPPNPNLRCTSVSVAAHTLYENPSPIYLIEPPGTLDTTKCVYEAVSDRAVRVTGSAFIPAQQYTVRLEAAELVGYRSLCIGGIRDAELIASLDDHLTRVREMTHQRLKDTFFGRVDRADYTLMFHVYGKNGVMGDREPLKDVRPHEVGLLIIVVAKTQSLATAILTIARIYAVHTSYGKRKDAIVTNMAFPISPFEIETGPVYRFTMNHVLELDDPSEAFRTEYTDL